MKRHAGFLALGSALVAAVLVSHAETADEGNPLQIEDPGVEQADDPVDAEPTEVTERGVFQRARTTTNARPSGPRPSAR